VIPVLKGFDANQTMLQFLNSAFYNDEFPNELMEKVVVHDAYHFGGYGKYSKELLVFIQQIYKEYQLPLDPVYTGKAFYGMMRALESPIFDGKKILFIHTGGLQGCKSIEQKEEIELHPK
jgi:1-aminocyclopropane-1-carboxylate deaminase